MLSYNNFKNYIFKTKIKNPVKLWFHDDTLLINLN